MKSDETTISNKNEILLKMEKYLEVVQTDPSHRSYWYVYKQIQKLDFSDMHIPEQQQIKIALFSSFTIDLLAIYLDINCRLLGLSPSIYIGPFNQYQQEILDINSKLYSFNPDITIFNIHHDSVLTQGFIENFPRLSDEEKQKEQNSVESSLYSIIDSLSQNLKSLILFSNFIIPVFSPYGIIDSKKSIGFVEFFKQLNKNMVDKYKNNSQVFVFDLDAITSNFGKNNAINNTMYYRGSILFSDQFLPVLAYGYESYIKALKNLNRKCIVLDLDNTLWGGIIGEDGMEGIKLSTNHPGNEFVDFQNLILTYYNRGVILAINSKNNFEDAMEVIQNHPDMVLREKHFASMQINWNDKVQNMVAIAKELNIGLDSLVFIDDNPVERARVREALPEILVPEMPKNFAHYKQTLQQLNDFNTYSLTTEDLKRGEMYVARRKRENLKVDINSMDDFIRSLGITAEIKRSTEFSLPRITSLINRTNQFNLTTRRYTEHEIQQLHNDISKMLILSLKVTDKFGDEGIVGLAMVEKSKDQWKIDNFLMSCRVIGRKIDLVLLHKIIKEAKIAGVNKLIGEHIPSKKNRLVKDFFSSNNFTLIEETNGVTKWKLDLNQIEATFPEFITVIENE